jgi:hypothetical protein
MPAIAAAGNGGGKGRANALDRELALAPLAGMHGLQSPRPLTAGRA